jgi:hypothetical protein
MEGDKLENYIPDFHDMYPSFSVASISFRGAAVYFRAILAKDAGTKLLVS